MKKKKIFYVILAAVNLMSFVVMIILTVIGSSLAKSQGYNYAAERWNSDGEYAQISCFISNDSDFTTDSVGGIKAGIISSLQNISVMPEEDKKFIPEAYSSPAGQATIRSDKTTGRSEAELTAVGGDFFLFRDFSLLCGSYFSDDDIMQDGIVIDRSLAWALYGSDNIAGMNVYIDGVKFYISGVIDNPNTKQEKNAVGELPQAYISYYGMELINSGMEFKNISCYECIVPNPVENYAYNAVDEYFKESYKGKYAIVNNTTRFNPSVRAKSFKKLSDYAVRDTNVIYPYWENASRVIEFELTEIYFFRRFTFVIPIITALYLIIVLWKKLGILRHNMTDWIIDKITRIIYNHNERKRLKEENK